LEDTVPAADRTSMTDPFAAHGELKADTMAKLSSSLKSQKAFRIEIEPRRQGYNRAGTASTRGKLSPSQLGSWSVSGEDLIGNFAQQNGMGVQLRDVGSIPVYRITVNDRLVANQQFATIAHELGHIFCGHLGGCLSASGREDESGWPDRISLGHHEKEIEAEAVVTASASYLKVHVQNADTSKIDLDLIVRAAARIERLTKIHYGTMVFR
jgi:hypothetical protein